jgi:hypothetical protein
VAYGAISLFNFPLALKMNGVCFLQGMCSLKHEHHEWYLIEFWIASPTPNNQCHGLERNAYSLISNNIVVSVPVLLRSDTTEADRNLAVYAIISLKIADWCAMVNFAATSFVLH